MNQTTNLLLIIVLLLLALLVDIDSNNSNVNNSNVNANLSFMVTAKLSSTDTSDRFISGAGYIGSGNMKTLLSKYEGYRNCKYRDTKGIATIGIGWNLESNNGTTGRLIGINWPNCINDGQVNTLYEYSVKRAAEELYDYLPWAKRLPNGVRDVLVRMSFNMGIGNSSRGLLSFKNTLELLRRGDYQGAANGFRNSQWCRDVKTTRCTEETTRIARGE